MDLGVKGLKFWKRRSGFSMQPLECVAITVQSSRSRVPGTRFGWYKIPMIRFRVEDLEFTVWCFAFGIRRFLHGFVVFFLLRGLGFRDLVVPRN